MRRKYVENTRIISFSYNLRVDNIKGKKNKNGWKYVFVIFVNRLVGKVQIAAENEGRKKFTMRNYFDKEV